MSAKERWLSLPFWVKLSIRVLLWVPWMLALPVAMFGWTGDIGGSVGGLVAFVAASASSRYRDEDYWTLSAAERVCVRRVVRSGIPSGNPELDDVAAGLFQRTFATPRANLIIGAVLAIVVVGVPVVAAVRVDARWLLVLLTVALLAWSYSGARPRARSWEQFQRAVAARDQPR